MLQLNGNTPLDAQASPAQTNVDMSDLVETLARLRTCASSSSHASSTTDAVDDRSVHSGVGVNATPPVDATPSLMNATPSLVHANASPMPDERHDASVVAAANAAHGLPSINTTVPPATTAVLQSPKSRDTPNSARSSHRSSEVPLPEPNQATTNVYVGGLHDTVNDAELERRFGVFGNITSAKVMLHIHTGMSRGIGFVKFDNTDSAAAAVAALNRTLIAGQRITVRFADSRADYKPGEKTNKVFVRNVPFDVTNETLCAHFAEFGTVSECTMHLDTAGFKAGGTGVRSRIAYLTMDSVEVAERAANAVHGTKPFPTCFAALMSKVAESDSKRSERRTNKGKDRAPPAQVQPPPPPQQAGAQPVLYQPTYAPVQQQPMQAMQPVMYQQQQPQMAPMMFGAPQQPQQQQPFMAPQYAAFAPAQQLQQQQQWQQPMQGQVFAQPPQQQQQFVVQQAPQQMMFQQQPPQMFYGGYQQQQ